MRVTRNVITIFDLNEDLQRKELVINKDYQRNGALWPNNAASFFIDTILNGFPFPKITIRQTINPSTMKAIKEVVDGQQRLLVIKNFIENKFSLSSVSQDFRGMRFNDLSEDLKQNFLSYEVSVDTVISGTEKEILEVFRRMNSYSLPLNKQELRHSNYQGDFKWFMFNFAEEYSEFLIQTDILTLKQAARMVDSELLSEICLIITNGIEAKSQPKLNSLYKTYDNDLPQYIEQELNDLMRFLVENFQDICNEEKMTSYQFYSFCAALLYNKYNHDIIDDNNFDSEGLFCQDIDVVKENILYLFDILTQRDSDDTSNILNPALKEFITASSATTSSYKNRLIRTKCFLSAIQDSDYIR